MISKNTFSPGQHSVELINVSPTLAEAWLQRNINNRKIRPGKVEAYTRDMENGRWTASAHSICFDTRGILQNGQHTLSAIVKSGTTQRLVVQFGLPPEAMANMDTGAARSTADVLRWNDETRAHLLAATAKLSANCLNGNIYRDTHRQVLSPMEITDFIDRHPDIREAVLIGDRLKNKVGANPTSLATAAFLIQQSVGVEATEQFFHRLGSGANEPEGSPILALRTRLFNMRMNSEQLSNREVVALIIRAWNHDVRGASVSYLSVSRGEFRIPEVLIAA